MFKASRQSLHQFMHYPKKKNGYSQGEGLRASACDHICTDCTEMTDCTDFD